MAQLLSAASNGRQLAADVIKNYLQSFTLPQSINTPTALNLYNIDVFFNNTQCNILQNHNNLILQNTNVLNTSQDINLALPPVQDNIIEISDNTESLSKKRQAPDFDDYNTTSLKRIKTENGTIESTTDEFKPFQGDNNINLTERETTDDLLQIIKTKWHVDQLSNPHIDHTRRIFNGSNLSNKSIRYNTQGFHYYKEPPLITDTDEPYVLCVRVFDDEIEGLNDELKRIHRDIITLYRNVSVCVDYTLSCRITNEIDALRSRENRLKTRYACLCDARDEIYSLYGNSEKSSLHFNAKFITWDEVNIVKETRRVLDSYESFYSSSRR